MGTDQTVSPVFIQKNMRHKNIQSTLNYLKPSLGQALRANDLLCGNAPGEGWDARYTGNKRSLQPHLPKTSIKPAPQTSSNVNTGVKFCHPGLAKVRKTAPVVPKSTFDPARYNLKTRSAMSKRITNPPGPPVAPSTAGTVVPGDASSHRNLILERLRASGLKVNLVKAPPVKGGVNKPHRVSVLKPTGITKKALNPKPNLKVVRNRLSGCSVTVSQTVSATPQEAPAVIPDTSDSQPNLQEVRNRLSGCSVSVSQTVTATPQEVPAEIPDKTDSNPSFASKYEDWCRSKKEERDKTEDNAESLHSKADSATLTASDPDIWGQFSSW